MSGQVHGSSLSINLGAFGPQQPLSHNCSRFVSGRYGNKEDSWRFDKLAKLVIFLEFLVSTFLEFGGSTTSVQESSYFRSFEVPVVIGNGIELSFVSHDKNKMKIQWPSSWQ